MAAIKTKQFGNDATNSLDNFELNVVAKQLEQFLLEDLSRLYIQLVRERISDEDTTPHYILNHSLLTNHQATSG